MNTDHDWETWGHKDPYFGVLTAEKYRAKNITEQAKVDFFESGEAHVKHVLFMCRAHFDPNFSPKRVLDFGCGVGRLVIPLAKVASEVVGIDISESMLKEAYQNCEEHRIENVRLLKSDDVLSNLTGKFDFIHSFVVLQHIPIRRGKLIFLNLINHLADEGVAAIHITYEKSQNRRKLQFVKTVWLRDLLRSGGSAFMYYWRKITQPSVASMQMNSYNLNEILLLIQSAGFPYSVVEFTDHGGELGVLLYFQKPSSLSSTESKL